MNAIHRACELVGGVSKMATLLEVAAPTVSQWVREVRPVPLDHCPFIELHTKGKVPCEQLRPDKVKFFDLMRSLPRGSVTVVIAGEGTSTEEGVNA